MISRPLCRTQLEEHRNIILKKNSPISSSSSSFIVMKYSSIVQTSTIWQMIHDRVEATMAYIPSTYKQTIQ